MAALCGARITEGFAFIANALGLEERIQKADLVLTGEGRLDVQTTYGKGPGALAVMARSKGRRTVIFAGMVDSSFKHDGALFDGAVQVGPAPAAGLALERAVESWARSEVKGHSPR